jgi:short-subunit dehydrogenase
MDANVMVTGASRGIGPVIARTLAALGGRIIAVARDRSGLEATCRDIETAGGTAAACVADLAQPDGFADLVDRASSHFGPLDVVVHNAGVEHYRRHQDLSAEQLRAVLTVNLHAPLEITRLVLPTMLERGRGCIVSIASLAGKKGVAFNGSYSASKAGIIAWTEALRQELAGTGVRAAVVMPGYIRDAGMFAKDEVEPPAALGTSSPQEVADAVVAAILEGRDEVIVNRGPMRPLLALGQLFPTLSDRLVDWMGIKAMSERRIKP